MITFPNMHEEESCTDPPNMNNIRTGGGGRLVNNGINYNNNLNAQQEQQQVKKLSMDSSGIYSNATSTQKIPPHGQPIRKTSRLSMTELMSPPTPTMMGGGGHHPSFDGNASMRSHTFTGDSAELPPDITPDEKTEEEKAYERRQRFW